MEERHLTFIEKEVMGVPLIECYDTKKMPKKLCFINHGFTSNKGEGTYFMMFELAKLGLHVVSVDAYKHGDRIEEPMITGSESEQIREIYDYIIQTGKDIKMLYDDVYQEQYGDFMICGISMGGAETFYAGMMIPQAKWLAPMIGFPSFYDFGKADFESLGIDLEEAEQYLEALKVHDPTINIERFKGKNLLILNGNKDDVVPVKYARNFYEKAKNVDRIEARMVEFPVGHEVPSIMQEEVYKYIRQVVLK